MSRSTAFLATAVAAMAIAAVLLRHRDAPTPLSVDPEDAIVRCSKVAAEHGSAVAPSAIECELEFVRARVSDIRRGAVPQALQSRLIASVAASRQPVVSRLLDANHANIETLYQAALREPDRDVRHVFARLLRPVAPQLRSRLLALASSAEHQSLVAAACGSPLDAEVHAVLDVYARTASDDAVRQLAVESFGSTPAHYVAWDGIGLARATLTTVMQHDPVAGVRDEAAKSLAALGGEVAARPDSRSREARVAGVVSGKKSPRPPAQRKHN